MKDRTGQVWNDGKVTALVTGESSLNEYGNREHPVAILESAVAYWRPGETDVWREIPRLYPWEGFMERLA